MNWDDVRIFLAIARNGERGLTEEDESDEAEVDAESTAPETNENPEEADA